MLKIKIYKVVYSKNYLFSISPGVEILNSSNVIIKKEGWNFVHYNKIQISNVTKSTNNVKMSNQTAVSEI